MRAATLMLRDDLGVSFSVGRATNRTPRQGTDDLSPGWERHKTSRRRIRREPPSPFPTLLFPHLSFPFFFCFSCLRPPSHLLHIDSPAFCGSDIPPLPHGSVLLAHSTVRYTVHVSTSKLAEPTRPAVEVFLFNCTTDFSREQNILPCVTQTCAGSWL